MLLKNLQKTVLPNGQSAFVAEGLQSLQETLIHLAENNDNHASAVYLLYRVGQLQSLLKIDSTVMPVQIWHYNLQGWPLLAGGQVEKTLHSVFNEKLAITDVSGDEKRQQQKDFLEGGQWQTIAPHQATLENAFAKLEPLKQSDAQAIEIKRSPFWFKLFQLKQVKSLPDNPVDSKSNKKA